MLKKYNSSWHQNRKLGNILSVHVSSPFPSSNPIMFPTMTMTMTQWQSHLIINLTIPVHVHLIQQTHLPVYSTKWNTNCIGCDHHDDDHHHPYKMWLSWWRWTLGKPSSTNCAFFLTLLQIFYYTKGFLATWNWLLSIYNVQGLFCQDNNYNWYCDNR